MELVRSAYRELRLEAGGRSVYRRCGVGARSRRSGYRALWGDDGLRNCSCRRVRRFSCLIRFIEIANRNTTRACLNSAAAP